MGSRLDHWPRHDSGNCTTECNACTALCLAGSGQGGASRQSRCVARCSVQVEVQTLAATDKGSSCCLSSRLCRHHNNRSVRQVVAGRHPSQHMDAAPSANNTLNRKNPQEMTKSIISWHRQTRLHEAATQPRRQCGSTCAGRHPSLSHRKLALKRSRRPPVHP